MEKPAPQPDHMPFVRLSNDETARYQRHIMLSQVGHDGQLKLKAARVLIVGVGGLGSPVAMYLAAAGIGHIGLVDPDAVEISDLQRQIIHSDRSLGKPKPESAAQRLADLNPFTRVSTYNVALDKKNAPDIIGPYDIVVDATDNFPSRYVLNEASHALGKPYVYGSIFRFEGQVSVFGMPGGPCYRCFLPNLPPPGSVPNAAEVGVLGVLPGTIGTIQATEVIKLVLNIGEPLVGRLLLYDALDMQFDTITLTKRLDCPVCGHPSP